MSEKIAPKVSAPRRPGVAYRRMFRVLSGVHGFLYRRGMARSMGPMQQILLTTTGRKTGQPPTVPLGALPEGDGWVVIASFNGNDVHPSWWLNLVAHPAATVQINDQIVRVRMQEITDAAERERIWNSVVSTLNRYAGYAKKTSRMIPLGLLRPIA